ncbi:expressed protein [Phakopsora pachyrhizi]|uniref:Expressed protein n=1 Tax=Phakopsora pachyrhizi TaxID=170000 RepID=A0AAV0ALY0_PHAPC|nr:expressed protein [Phakopsora pachyrhizi]
MEDTQKVSSSLSSPALSGLLISRRASRNNRSPIDYSILDDMLKQEVIKRDAPSPISISAPDLLAKNSKAENNVPQRPERVSIDVTFDKAALSNSSTFHSEVFIPLGDLKPELSSISFPKVNFGSTNKEITQETEISLIDNNHNNLISREAQSGDDGCKDSLTESGVTFWSSRNHLAIHANQLSELPRPGQTFEDLFQPDFLGSNLEAVDEVTTGSIFSYPPEDDIACHKAGIDPIGPATPPLSNSSRTSLELSFNGWKNKVNNCPSFKTRTESFSSKKRRQSSLGAKILKSVEPAIWWLDLTSPTKEEIKFIGKAFNIHPLTVDSISTQEPREKVEIFRHYYFVCYQSFYCKTVGRNPLHPVIIYILVFREGILTLHLPKTPHPSNVRRRIHNLKDHINLTTDWICYSLIDDITGIYSPLISQIEDEIDRVNKDDLLGTKKEAFKAVIRCRQEVIELSRLLKNKSDVVKALSKRCSEENSHILTPDSDISLYLSDVQDHLMNMTQNLDHYERILNRCHSDYLAILSIEIAASGSRVNQILGRLTTLGSIIVPMNVLCTIWGMNVSLLFILHKFKISLSFITCKNSTAH